MGMERKVTRVAEEVVTLFNIYIFIQNSDPMVGLSAAIDGKALLL